MYYHCKYVWNLLSYIAGASQLSSSVSHGCVLPSRPYSQSETWKTSVRASVCFLKQEEEHMLIQVNCWSYWSMYWNLKQYLSYHNWGHPPTESTQRWAIMALPAYVHVLLLQVNTLPETTCTSTILIIKAFTIGHLSLRRVCLTIACRLSTIPFKFQPA